MKTVYLVKVSIVNGTTTINTYTNAFYDVDLAKKTRKKILELNKDSNQRVICYIEKSSLFEDESEVPILNKLKNQEGDGEGS